MWTTERAVAAGDVAIAFMTRDLIHPFVVEPGKDLNNKFGYYRHSDLVGLPWGSKVGSRNGKGFIHILRPTPELWTLALPHRTQILYLADISFIVSWLNIRPGSTVIEAGTGSGSFTHSIARTVGSSGKVYTYEFHEARAAKAREEFRAHGMSDVVTLTHMNVCKDGFTVENTADAVFLDLPAPWDAVEHAKKALRDDRTTRICCFSPCMEQVLRTVSSLNEAGFTEIAMYETLLRPHEVNEVPVLPSISTAAEKLKLHERKREDKRMRQIAASQAKHIEKQQKRKRDDSDDAPDAENENEAKRIKTGDAEHVKGAASLDEISREHDAPATAYTNLTPGQVGSAEALVDELGQQVVSRVVPEVRGHTSYLTFALLLPRVPVAAAAANVEDTSSKATLAL